MADYAKTSDEHVADERNFKGFSLMHERDGVLGDIGEVQTGRQDLDMREEV